MLSIIEQAVAVAIRLVEEHPDLAKAVLDHVLAALGMHHGASDTALTEIASGLSAATANAVQEAVRRGRVKAGAGA